jgi:hypothetical protein
MYFNMFSPRRSLTNNVLSFILGMHIIFVHVIITCIKTRHGNFAFLVVSMICTSKP